VWDQERLKALEGLTIGFFSYLLLVFLLNEEAGMSTSFLYCSSKEMVCARGFGVLGERGLDGEIVLGSSDFLPVLIVK
jgi:hypothetical protein